MSPGRAEHRAVAVVALTGAFIVAMDWVPTPLNRNIEQLGLIERVPGSLIHGIACASVCLAIVRGRWWTRWLGVAWFAVVLTSAVLNWWVPYLAGVYPGEIDPATFAAEYDDNLRLLPVRFGHPITPDVQHTLIHLLLLGSLVAVLQAARSAARPHPETVHPRENS